MVKWIAFLGTVCAVDSYCSLADDRFGTLSIAYILMQRSLLSELMKTKSINSNLLKIYTAFHILAEQSDHSVGKNTGKDPNEHIATDHYLPFRIFTS